VFSGKSKEEISKLGIFTLVREIPDGLKVQLPTRDVNQAVSKLMEMKASLLWVSPIRPSLESYFETAAERNVEKVAHGAD
jgi:hypothetical protein